jgi:hypothetical protein
MEVAFLEELNAETMHPEAGAASSSAGQAAAASAPVCSAAAASGCAGAAADDTLPAIPTDAADVEVDVAGDGVVGIPPEAFTRCSRLPGASSSTADFDASFTSNLAMALQHCRRFTVYVSRFSHSFHARCISSASACFCGEQSLMLLVMV